MTSLNFCIATYDMKCGQKAFSHERCQLEQQSDNFFWALPMGVNCCELAISGISFFQMPPFDHSCHVWQNKNLTGLGNWN